VLYLLDGDHAFAMATDMVQYLIYGEHIPDLIIVSPAYGSKNTPEYGGTNMRNRDLVPFPTQWSNTPPGGANFLHFFGQELLPFVASTYRVNESDRTLAGYAFGAFFVLYALFQNPDLFNRLIAIDGFEGRFLVMEEAFSATHSTHCQINRPSIPSTVLFSETISPLMYRSNSRSATSRLTVLLSGV
jgi:Putative esterase